MYNFLKNRHVYEFFSSIEVYILSFSLAVAVLSDI